MRNFYLVIFIISVLLSCNGQQSMLNETNLKYKNHHLKKFDKDFIDHFPSRITTPKNTIISAENTERGFIGMLLYEYDMEVEEIITIENRLKNEAMKYYKSEDSCLLVINRFDTDKTFGYPKKIILPDSISVNRSCYQDLLPIPKFFKYKNEDSNSIKNETMLPSGFNIYVLEAKSGNYFGKYDLISNRQMPDGWKNGYSKGVAVSQKHRCVIYWSVAF